MVVAGALVASLLAAVEEGIIVEEGADVVEEVGDTSLAFKVPQ